MHVQIKHDDGSETDYFGIPYFAVSGDQITLHFHRDVAIEDTSRVVDGSVSRCVDESGYNEQGAKEVIRDRSTEPDSGVVVGVTSKFSEVASVADFLDSDDEFDGDLEIHR